MGMTLEQMAMLEPTEEQVWRQAQKDYEGGVPVGEVCARYGLKRATVYQRAQVWRAAEANAFDPEAPAPKAADLAQTAWLRLGRAVEGGRVHEALCWRRLLESLESRAAKDAWGERIKDMDQDQALETLLDECDRTVAMAKARKAATIAAAPEKKPAPGPSLDTLPPAPSSDGEEEAADEAGPGAEEGYDAESVASWRSWAALSDQLDRLGEEGLPRSAQPQFTEEDCGPALGSAGGEAAGERVRDGPSSDLRALETEAERERTGPLRV